mgnify:CR=1 FL=1|tara:strand:+ start:184 stop:822 length:639 start_codon:yes stop_codon:yes gene_type:complete
MGYLDNDTIVVDAILTKHGRKILSDGGSINPTSFALSDDGIDYSLWNKTSPSGSSGYDDYITKLPMIEAVPDDQTLMRYKLISLDPNTQNMPIVTLGSGQSNQTITNSDTSYAELSPVTDQFVGESGYIFKVSDSTPILLTEYSGTIVDMSGTPVSYAPQQEIPSYIEIVGGSYVKMQAVSGLTSNKTVHVTIEGIDSGAITSANITVQANL